MKRKKLLIAILISCLLVIFLPKTTYADMGAKDQLAVYVENPPNELYYLDLLTQNSSPYNNFNQEGERESLDKKMVELLYSYESEGWMPALVEGTGVPMWGKLIGQADGERMVHKFGYVGVPDTYRIIVVTKSGNVSVSDVYTRGALQSSITFDYTTGAAVVPSTLSLYLLQFGWAFGVTIFVEGIILCLYGFSLKNNWKVFLLTNFITQVVLTITVGATLIKSGMISAYLVQIPVEIFIIISEAIIYMNYLLGGSNRRKIAYGIVANLVTWVGGFFLLNYMFQFLVKVA